MLKPYLYGFIWQRIINEDLQSTEMSSNKGFNFLHKNIARHIAHTNVLWPNPKQWLMILISDLIMIIRWGTNMLTLTKREVGKLKT